MFSNYLLQCVCYIHLLVLIVFAPLATNAWDSDQLEIFDLVEEINENFYKLLNVTQDADLQTIKRAFRSLSLVLHPDKNDSPDADVQFRNLVSVYDVLKDPGKREHYNEVVRNGLPNWKSAVYYYRHVRKMGLTETLATLFILVTIGQYLVAWAAYVENKYTAEQIYGAKLKKQQKKKGQVSADIIEKFHIPKPSMKNTLPVQIPCLLWSIIPTTIRFTIQLIQEYRHNRKLQQEEIDSESEKGDEEEEEEEVRRVRKRKTTAFIPRERDDDESDALASAPVSSLIIEQQPTRSRQMISGGLWTDDDLAELIHLVKKYPGGTSERWDRIAEAMNRSVTEVTYMAAKMKDNCYRLPDQQQQNNPEQQQQQSLDEQQPKKLKTRGGKINTTASLLSSSSSIDNSHWSQLQQKALESALAKYPKGPLDRWEKIAKCVPDKTKEECMLRYKYLVELVKKQKEKKENHQQIEE